MGAKHTMRNLTRKTDTGSPGNTPSGSRRICRGWLCGIAAALLGGLWTVALAASDTETYLQEAQSSFEKTVFPAAVVSLKNALRIEPDNGEARLLLGRAYLELNAGKSAAGELARARELGVPRERVLVPLGRALLMSGQAERLLQEITPQAGDPADLKLQILLLQGQACLATGRFALADERFSAVLAQRPASAGALLGKAHLSHRNGANAEAAGFIDQALAVEPGNTEAWAIKGALLSADGAKREAVAAFDRALAIDPANLPALLGRATARITLREPDKALWDLAAIKQLYPQLYQADYLTALARHQQQQPGPARESVQRALERQPAFPPAHLLAGTLAYQQGDFNRAEQHLRTYRSRNPANPDATKLLGAVLVKLNRPGQAVEVLEPGAAAAAGDAQYLALLGSALMADGETSRGVDYLQQAAGLAPDAAGIRNQLAIGRRVQGTLEGTASEIGGDAELDQDLLQADLLLAMTYLKRQAYDKALDAAEGMADKLPDSPVPQNLIGAAQVGRGDPVAARQAFEAAVRRQPDFLPPYFNLAQLDRQAGDSDAARARYREVLSRDKANLKALLALAAMAESEGNSAASGEWLEQARQAHPQDIRTTVMLAQHYLRGNDTRRALDAARSLSIAHPYHPATLQTLSLAQLKAGEDTAALATLESLVEVAAGSPQAHYQLAMVQIKLGNNPAARASLQRALELQPDFPQAQAALGRLEIADNHLEAAEAIARDMRQARPGEAPGEELTGDVLTARGDPLAAITHFEKAYDQAPSARLARKRFHAWQRAGDDARAEAALHAWLSTTPGDLRMRALLISSLEQRGEPELAIEQYLKLLEYQPEHVATLNNLALLYQETGNPAGLEYAERAHRLAPERPEVTDTLGWLLVQNGDTDRGLALLQEARVEAPQIPDIQYHVAVALHSAERSDEARKELDHLLKSGKAFPGIDQARVLHRQLGG
jgi:putative PEP-CTERM system TPR-repeat lipoprotein